MKLFNAITASAFLGTLGACSLSPELSRTNLEGQWSYNCVQNSGEEILYTVSLNGGNSSEVIFGSRDLPKEFQTSISSSQIELTSLDGRVNVKIDRATENQPENVDREKNYSLGKPVPFLKNDSGFKVDGTCRLKWWDNAKTAESREQYKANQKTRNVVNISRCESKLKSMLKDPGSYQRIEASPESYWVDFTYRAKNSFGGYNVEQWRCNV